MHVKVGVRGREREDGECMGARTKGRRQTEIT